MIEFVETIKQRFEKALLERDSVVLENVLQDFDEECRAMLKEDIDPITQTKMIEQCLALHNELESGLDKVKSEIQHELLNAKSNGKKINKYLNIR